MGSEDISAKNKYTLVLRKSGEKNCHSKTHERRSPKYCTISVHLKKRVSKVSSKEGGEDNERAAVRAGERGGNITISFGFAMDEDVKVQILLELDNSLDLLLDELLVLLGSNFTLGELVALNTDLLSLGERTDSSGGE